MSIGRGTHRRAAAIAAAKATALPDGSAFAVYSYPLPKGHWLYAPREYEQGAEGPKELAAPILTHAAREQVISAIRYAVRAATDCGKETDFDPDALVQNAVYALCGPSIKISPNAAVEGDDSNSEGSGIMDIDNYKLPNLPRAGAICYAMTMDVLTYKVPRVGNHMAGVYDTALWSTDQMKAYAKAAIAQYNS
jgi:hypothetical protein